MREPSDKAGSIERPLMAVGTFVVDYHKLVDNYPDERSGTRIEQEQVSSGGAPFNVLVNLSKLGVGFPRVAAAKVGRDLDGKFILECCRKHDVQIDQVRAIENATTGYTDVYSVSATGNHTCFHFCGIGDTFSRADVKLRAVDPKVLFLGSLGALGQMDRRNETFGRSGAAQLIRDARKQGITTVVEVSPINRRSRLEDFTECIAEADYLILNERVTENLLRCELYSESVFDPELAREAAQSIIAGGPRKAVVIQSSTGAVYLNKEQQFEFCGGIFCLSACGSALRGGTMPSAPAFSRVSTTGARSGNASARDLPPRWSVGVQLHPPRDFYRSRTAWTSASASNNGNKYRRLRRVNTVEPSVHQWRKYWQDTQRTRRAGLVERTALPEPSTDRIRICQKTASVVWKAIQLLWVSGKSPE